MDDLINRQDAINLLKKWSDGYSYIEVETASAIKEFQHLPSAQPERKKGRWNTDKESPEYATCSVCGHCDWDCTESEYFKYCPNCGAQMGSE